MTVYVFVPCPDCGCDPRPLEEDAECPCECHDWDSGD